MACIIKWYQTAAIFCVYVICLCNLVSSRSSGKYQGVESVYRTPCGAGKGHTCARVIYDAVDGSEQVKAALDYLLHQFTRKLARRGLKTCAAGLLN